MKSFAVIVLIFLGLYGSGMIILRFQMTQMAYEFESLKETERGLKEEQMKLRASLAKMLSPNALKDQDWIVPEPRYVVRIP